MTTLRTLDRNITQTIEKYVKYDCLSCSERERKRDRLDAVKHIRELCEVNGVQSREYVFYYYKRLKEKEGVRA